MGRSSVPQAGLGHSLMEHLLRKRTESRAGTPWAALAWHRVELCSISLQQSARWSLVGLFSAKQAKEIESRS